MIKCSLCAQRFQLTKFGVNRCPHCSEPHFIDNNALFIDLPERHRYLRQWRRLLLFWFVFAVLIVGLSVVLKMELSTILLAVTAMGGAAGSLIEYYSAKKLQCYFLSVGGGIFEAASPLLFRRVLCMHLVGTWILLLGSVIMLTTSVLELLR